MTLDLRIFIEPQQGASYASQLQMAKRAEELGYFKFGGSTVLLFFEPGKMVYDDDLVENSHGALETLVSTTTLLSKFSPPFPFPLPIILLIPSPRSE